MWARQPWDRLTQWSWAKGGVSVLKRLHCRMIMMCSSCWLTRRYQNDHKEEEQTKIMTAHIDPTCSYLLPSGCPFKAALPTADQLISPTGNQQISARIECSWPSVLGQEAGKERPSLKAMIKDNKSGKLSVCCIFSGARMAARMSP